jgi:hypothetical protein
MERKIHNHLVQGTHQWREVRLGRIGSSEAKPIITKAADGEFPKGLQTILYKKWAEKTTGNPADRDFTNYAMERGKELEPKAREEYCKNHLKGNTKVAEVGYITYGDFVGYSPDGVILKEGVDAFNTFDDAEGLIEIKCPEYLEFTRYMDTRDIKDEHIVQMQWGMWITGLPYCDYVVYNPDFSNSMMTHRVVSDEKMHDLFKQRIAMFSDEVEELNKKYKLIENE